MKAFALEEFFCFLFLFYVSVVDKCCVVAVLEPCDRYEGVRCVHELLVEGGVHGCHKGVCKAEDKHLWRNKLPSHDYPPPDLYILNTVNFDILCDTL